MAANKQQNRVFLLFFFIVVHTRAFQIAGVIKIGDVGQPSILEPSCCKKLPKNPNQGTGFGNRELLKVLNNTKLVINE